MVDKNVYTFNYSSHQTLETITNHLYNEIIKILPHSDYKLSFVAHNMGGVIVGRLIEKLDMAGIKWHDYISIATPFHGSKSARFISAITPRFLTGHAIREIRSPNIPSKTPVLILGRLSGFNRCLLSNELGDGVITDNECILKDKADYIVDAGHTKILWHSQTLNIIKKILI